MVVRKATLDEVLSRLSTAERGIGRSINPTVYSLAEFKSKLAAGNHLGLVIKIRIDSSAENTKPYDDFTAELSAVARHRTVQRR